MSEISLFAQEPLVLLLKIKKIQNNIIRDDGSGVLFAGLDDCATQLELFSTQALSAQNEREGNTFQFLHHFFIVFQLCVIKANIKIQFINCICEFFVPQFSSANKKIFFFVERT